MTRQSIRCTKPALLATLLLLPALAAAHPGLPGHHHTLAAGLLHPLLGIDHLLAMLAVGLWAAQQGGRATWLLPAGFVGGMIGGALLGLQGTAMALVEPGIAGSLLVLGLAVAAGRRVPVAAAFASVLLFGLCHGHAHGAEMPAGAAPLLYGAGFVFGTALLHGTGVLAGRVLLARALPGLLRLAGGAVALGGVAMLAGA